MKDRKPGCFRSDVSAPAAVLLVGAAAASVASASLEWRYSDRLFVVLLIHRPTVGLMGLDLGCVSFFWCASVPCYSSDVFCR